jgi:hypothetical protein
MLAIGMMPGSVFAEGSPTIGNPPKTIKAPLALPGKQQSGNTASDQMAFTRGVCGGSSEEYWVLPVQAGDKVVLQGAEIAPASGICVDIFPNGTTDANIANAVPVVEGIHLDQGATFTSRQPSSYVVAVGRGLNGNDGPFTFIVTTYHKALVSLPSLRKKIARVGRITAIVRGPTGMSITDPFLHLGLYGIWRNTPSKPASSHLLATRAPINGFVSFAYRLPKKLRGKLIRIRIIGHAKHYQPVSSAIRSVRVRAG